MRRVEWLNAAAAITALVVASLIMGFDNQPSANRGDHHTEASELRFTELPDGSRALIDATGQAIALRDYNRIVGGSIVARSLLGELCSKERIAAVISAGIDDAPDAHRFSGLPQIDRMNSTEQLLALKADLVIVNSLGSLPHIERLREAGLSVFALGNMRGVDTFLRDTRQISVLLGRPERGARLADGFSRRIENVASDIAAPRRKSGIYLSAYGTQMFGGTVGTSYHDVLRYGGLTDAAADGFSGWPQYTAEHVLSIDPEIIIGPEGIAQMICSGAPLNRLRACSNDRAGFVELRSSWLEDPSMVMLDVAESIREAVYGKR